MLPLVRLSSDEDFLCRLNLRHFGSRLMLSWDLSCSVSVWVPAVLLLLPCVEMWERDLQEPDLKCQM